MRASPRIDLPRDPSADPALLVMVGLGVWLAIVMLRNAWLSDDAFITFRIVDNFVHGRGMTWNPGQRVQAFTHPAWFFLVTAAYAITHEIFFTPIALCWLVSSIGVGLACTRLAASRCSAIAVLAALVFSRTFVDFSTSGLENPLSHLLLVIWLVLLRHRAPSASPSLWFDVVTGLVIFNRLDSALIVLPLWSWVLLQRFRADGFRAGVLPAMLCAGVPLVAWFLFATFYFGFPLPNTAYAKLGVGVAARERLEQGALYGLELIADDPDSAVLLGIGLGIALFRGRSWQRLAALGAIAYVGYVVWIGGDFMAGRFFSMPLVIAAAALLQLRMAPFTGAALAAMFAVVGTLGPTPPPLSGRHAEARGPWRDTKAMYGVIDERRFRFPELGLLSARRGVDMPEGEVREQARQLAGKPGEAVGGAGIPGFYVGPDTALIEIYGLADPFLARLPAKSGRNWLMGHFERPVPAGYPESLRSGRNELRDPQLAELYEQIQIITRGPLWSSQRLRSIIALNSGRLDPLARSAAEKEVPVIRRIKARRKHRHASDAGVGATEIDALEP